MHRAVFLDRDDTLIATTEATRETDHPGDLFDPVLVSLLPGVRESCAELKRAGLKLIIITNQACIARGIATVEQVEAVNDRIRSLLPDAAGGSLIDAVYYCPYHPTAVDPKYRIDHEWRKPRPGMIHAAAKEQGIDLQSSWLVGDSPRDVEAGIAAGMSADRCLRIGPAGPFASLAEAAQLIAAQR